MKINPYLNFDGEAENAFKFYQSVFGGELSIQKMGSAPGTEDLPEEEKNLAMHVSLPLRDGQVFDGIRLRKINGTCFAFRQ